MKARFKNKPKAEAGGFVEIARSFSYKLNAGNFESRDFFCAQKAECRASDAEKKSDELYAFCKRQVMRAVAEYREENQPLTSEQVRQRKAELNDKLRTAS
jgi:hypothetical protein